MQPRIITLLLALCLTAASCAPKQTPPQSAPQPKAGSTLMTSAEAVFAALDCAKKPLPFIALEDNSLTPNPAKPGSQLVHHLVYAFCPAPGGKADAGVLTRSLYYNGKQVFSDATRDFVLTPGRVAVDAVIAVPPEAQPGKYVYAVEYVSNAEAGKRKPARTLTLDEKLELALTR